MEHEEHVRRFMTSATRRRVVTTGVKLAYAAPLVAATMRLSASTAFATQVSPVSREGCSPGYYKNNGTYSQLNTTFASVGIDPTKVGLSANLTFGEALGFNGNKLPGECDQLLRQAAAAYLNASNPQISYPYGTGDIVSQTNAALAGGVNSATCDPLKNTFDSANNLGAKDNQGKTIC